MFSSSSSLAVSENSHHDLPRHKGSGFIKNGLFRHSKQEMVEKKMYGHKGKRKKGHHGISPSEEGLDDMISHSSHNKSKKTKMFSRKSYG